MGRNCVKSVCIRSFSGWYFPVFGLNAERYRVPLRIQSKFRKIQSKLPTITDQNIVKSLTNFCSLRSKQQEKRDQFSFKKCFHCHFFVFFAIQSFNILTFKFFLVPYYISSFVFLFAVYFCT